MKLFEAVKEAVTARSAAEYYGIKVGRNGMAVCPFHPDKNLSRPRQHRHLKRKNSILFLVFLDFPHFFIHSGWQDTLF